MTIAALGLIPLFFFQSAVPQDQPDVIHIKLVNGLTGKPIVNTEVGLEDRDGYRNISVHTNASGIATLTIKRNAEILVHNTHAYVNCADEPGGRINNQFNLSEIFSTGIVQPVTQPNTCHKTSGETTPGQLVLFVRHWKPGEDHQTELGNSNAPYAPSPHLTTSH
jgi:hypothetical protein